MNSSSSSVILSDSEGSSSSTISEPAEGSCSSFVYEQNSSAYEQPEVITVKDKSISGVSQKGPFVTGSAVKLYELDGKTYAQTGKSFTGKIVTDDGKFSVSSVTLASQYALLEANGYFRNEIIGGKSNGIITLNALTDLTDRKTVNINLLTHLEYERALYLVNSGINVPSAKKQAEAEILNAFGIKGEFASSEDLDIFSKGDGNAALLAFSVLMLRNLSEADLTELLTKFATDIESDGSWDDDVSKTKIADWAQTADLAGELTTIRSNIEKWNLGTVPEFEKYVRNFWYTNYGLGECGANNKAEVLAAKNERSTKYGTQTRYICKDGAWVEASNIEKDTYKWDTGEDGEIRAGDVTNNIYVFDKTAWRIANKVESKLGGCVSAIADSIGDVYSTYFVCKSNKWIEATDIEKDTYKWKAGEDGEIRSGNVTDNIYVFDKTAWRIANKVESKLGGCVSAIADSIGNVYSTYFICKSSKWIEASDIEKDTYKWKAGEDGEIRTGDVTLTKKYDYDAKLKKWRDATTVEAVLGGCIEAREKDFSLNTGKLNGIWYICKNREWESTNNVTVDTQGWINGSDGDLKRGDSTDIIYKYDEAQKAWLTATHNDTTLKLRGCTTNRNGEIGKSSFNLTYYKCIDMYWQKAEEIEYDTYGEKCTNKEIGKKIDGVVNTTNKYYCATSGWVVWTDGWSWEIPKEAHLNSEITYGTMTDSRDKKVYKTIKIGNQVWMAENLNYADSIKTPSLKGKNWCYNNDVEKCAVTGRFYTWAAAIDSVKLYDGGNGVDCGYNKTCMLPERVQGICPSGWHLPTETEWNTLFTEVGGQSTAGKFLNTQTGWNGSGNGTDAFGFSALPAGYRGRNEGDFSYIGAEAYFWSSTELEGDFAYRMWLRDDIVIASLACDSKFYGYSVRCLQD